jgi:hypothetical protein
VIDFLKSLTLALAPIALSHVLDVRKAKVTAKPADDADAESFAVYVNHRKTESR